jgi:hypothetical protein
MTEASDYALLHLPAHLADAGRDGPLYDLARDPTFSGRQSARFVSEPKVSLSAQRAALMTAASRDDAVAVAEFALRHLLGLHLLSGESPLTAARSGALDRAWRLAEYPDTDDRSLWYLLLAWELAARGESAASEASLMRLLKLEPTELSPGPYLDQQNWRNEYARLFLENLASPASPVLEELASRLIPDHQREAALNHVGHWLLRDRTVDLDPIPSARREAAIAADALRHAVAGDITAARRTLNAIPLDGYSFRTDAYIRVIGSLRAQGRLPAAIALAAEAIRPLDPNEQLSVARVQALAGLAAGAAQLDHRLRIALLGEGERTARTFEDAQLRFEACREIACAALMLVGLKDYHRRISDVMGPDDKPAQAEIGAAACGVLAQFDQLDAALELAAGLPEPFWWKSFQNQSYAAISRALSAKGDLRRAVEVARRITVHTWEASAEGVSLAVRADALAGVVAGAAEAGETRLADAAYQEILTEGSGTEGALDEWNASCFEAFAALLLHLLVTRGGDGIRRLVPPPAGISASDLDHFARAADSIAAGEWDGGVEHVAAVGDPIWSARALCRMARLRSRAEALRLAALSLARVSVARHPPSQLRLLEEISAVVEPLGDPEAELNVTALMNQVCVELTGGTRTLLPSAVDLALRHWRLDKLKGVLGEAAEWPSAAYRLCVVLAKGDAGTAERIVTLVRTIDRPPVTAPP